MSEKPESQQYRVKLVYRADGMTRPLTHTQLIRAIYASEALQLTVNFIRSAYVSGFEVQNYMVENLDKPVTLRYVTQEG